MRVAAQVVLTEEQKGELERFARGRRIPARLVQRARIVLLAADKHTDLQISERLAILPRTAARWRARFLKLGVAGLEHDAPRPGRTAAITAEAVREVIEKTTRQKPPNRTHWSTRAMAATAGISEASVRRIWHAHGLKPHRLHPFKLSNDPRFAEKLEERSAMIIRIAQARQTNRRAVILAKPESLHWLLFVLVCAIREARRQPQPQRQPQNQKQLRRFWLRQNDGF